MKKLITIIGLVILSITFTCVATTKIFAADDWYIETAERVNNPVLLDDEQYYKGITINSHIISDLTFMEIPFNEYLTNEDKKLEILTFSEARYIQNSEVKSELAMYVYLPGGNYDLYDQKNIQVNIQLFSQSCLYGTDFVETLNSVQKRRNLETTWTKVSQYGSLVKYTFGKITNYKEMATLSEIFCKKYSGDKNLTEVHTVFNATVQKYRYYDTVWKNYEIIERDKAAVNMYDSQEFQFIHAKSNPLAEQGIMMLSNTTPIYELFTACVARNKGTVSVAGKTVKYRYLMDDDPQLIFFNPVGKTKWVDVYYFFFNVFDDLDNSKWGKEKYITKVNLNYVLAEASYRREDLTSLPSLNYVGSGIRNYHSFAFLDSSGNYIYNETGKKELFNITNYNATEEEIYQEATNQLITNLHRTELYHKQTITPEYVTFDYITNSILNSWTAYLDFFLQTEKTTYMTLFNTSSQEFKNIQEQSPNMSTDLATRYQFGLVYGDRNGYPVYRETWSELDVFSNTWSINEYCYYMLDIANVIDINYEENGVTYMVSVSETEIDHSNSNIPQQPADDPFQSEEQGPKADDGSIWEWLQKVFEFFTVELPKWWEENGAIVIGAIIFIVVVIVVIIIAKKIREYKIMKAIQNPNTTEPPKKPKQKKKKE